MHPAATSWRGPSPWSGDGAVPPPRLWPRTRSERLFAAAAVQLIAVLVWSAWLLPAIAALAANQPASIPLPLAW